MWLDAFVQDSRFAFRSMRRAPAFTLTAIACLALGIGANTAIFTVIDKVLLEPLPYPESDRIVVIGRPGNRGSETPRRYGYWMTAATGLDHLTAWRETQTNLEAEPLRALAVSRNYFPLFSATPVYGRAFTEAEDRPHGPRVAVLSESLYRRGYELGQSIRLNDVPYTIVGVLPAGFVSYPRADLWLPLQADAADTSQASTLTAAARLPPGLSLAQAQARMEALAARYTRERKGRVEHVEIQVAPLSGQISAEVRPLLLLLWGAVALVLLIACANVANMLLARAAGRQKEFAIRTAIGAAPGRLIAQLLTESFLLASAGAAAGLVLGRVALDSILALTPGELPRAWEIANATGLDPRIAAFTVATAFLAAIAFGLYPAVYAARQRPAIHRNRTLATLVAAELALALVLLCGAALLMRSFTAMRALSLGFDSSNLLAVELSLAAPRFQDPAQVDRTAAALLEGIGALEGVESVALSSALPLYGTMDMIFDIPGRLRPSGQPFTGDVQWRWVTPGYFSALRIPILAGRNFRAVEPARCIIVSRELARRFFSSQNAIGQSIHLGPGLGPGFEAGPYEIVGIAGDVRERFDHAAGSPVLYVPPSQIPPRDMALMNQSGGAALLIRTHQPPAVMEPAIRRALIDLPPARIRTMEQAGFDSTAQHNFNLLLFALFAAAALMLAAIGVYGVVSFSVEQRTREIGIRMALGATAQAAANVIVRRAAVIAAAGLAAGLAASAASTRLLQSQLFGVTPLDTVTFTATPAILLLIAMAAAYLPARRASRVDPAVTLRSE